MADLSILLEAYRGKKSEFPEIEQQLKILINTIREHTKNFTDFSTLDSKPLDVHNLPANKKVEKLLAKAFNLREVNLYWKPRMYNVMTVPPVLSVSELNKNLDNDIMTNARIDIYIGERLIALTTINEKELLAAILHEIGHCHSMSPIISITRFLQCTILLPISLLGKLFTFTGLKLDEFMRKYTPKLYNAYKMVTGLQMSALHPINKIGNMPLKIKPDLNPGAVTVNYGHYTDEKIADSFAVSFGYGPYLISILDKIDKVDNSVGSDIINNSKIARLVSDIVDVHMTFIDTVMMEPHPSLNTRYHNALRNLKEDLQDPELDPSYRKEMLQQIKELEDSYELLGKRGGDGIELKHNVNKFIDSLTGDRPDFREVFNKLYSDKYRF